MPERVSFDYAVIRVVPHVEREEFINAGIILFCREKKFLDARFHLDAARVKALCPTCDVAVVQNQLESFSRLCAGETNAEEIKQMTQAERFRWLTSPRSTTIQISPAHSGLCDDPRQELERLFKEMTR
jgi:hypothetical protein